MITKDYLFNILFQQFCGIHPVSSSFCASYLREIPKFSYCKRTCNFFPFWQIANGTGLIIHIGTIHKKISRLTSPGTSLPSNTTLSYEIVSLLSRCNSLTGIIWWFLCYLQRAANFRAKRKVHRNSCVRIISKSKLNTNFVIFINTDFTIDFR